MKQIDKLILLLPVRRKLWCWL